MPIEASRVIASMLFRWNDSIPYEGKQRVSLLVTTDLGYVRAGWIKHEGSIPHHMNWTKMY